MEKIDIVNKIIDFITKNQDISSNRESGIIVYQKGSFVLKYFIAIKELWRLPSSDIKDEDLMKYLPKKLAGLETINKKLELIKSSPETELLNVLDDLEIN